MSNPTSKKKLLDDLAGIDPEKAKVALIRIYKEYLNPAFGALPKKENEIVMFQVLQDLQIFSNSPDQYSMLSSLRVTKAKARNLLYESKLRQNVDLDGELKELLTEPVLLKDDDKVCLEIDNPLLIDHLKHVLKKEKFITDGSFSPDLVKLSSEAYKALLNSFFGKMSKKELNQALIECGAKQELTIKSLLTGFLKKIGNKVADDAGDEAAEFVGDYLSDLLSSSLTVAKDFLKKNLDKEVELKRL